MTSHTIKNTENGVDVGGLTTVIQSIEEQPSLGMCRFRGRNRWHTGAHNSAEYQGFFRAGEEDTSRDGPFVHQMDEPPILVGENRGANPAEYVLTALSGCLTTTLVYYAAILGIPLNSVESELEGDVDLNGLFDLDAGVRKGYQNIRVTYRIESDAPRERIEELVQIAQRHSVVFDTIKNPVPIAVQLA